MTDLLSEMKARAEKTQKDYDDWGGPTSDVGPNEIQLAQDNLRLIAALEEFEKQIIAKVNYHEKHYSLEIFPGSDNLTDKSSRDHISANMGRHMCKCFYDYVEESKTEITAKLRGEK